HGPALRALRQGPHRAGLNMRSGEFHTSYRADMAIFETARARQVLAVFLVVLFAVPLFGSSYWLDVLNRTAIAVVAAMGLNILTGFTGQISLGNAAFMAIGAYSTAWFAGHGLPFVVVIPLAGILAPLAGMIFGVPSLQGARLRRQLVLRRGGGLAARVPGAHHQPGELPALPGDRSARHGHHRRTGQRAGLDPRSDLPHTAPRGAADSDRSALRQLS